jgi:hypothetical protein
MSWFHSPLPPFVYNLQDSYPYLSVVHYSIVSIFRGGKHLHFAYTMYLFVLYVNLKIKIYRTIILPFILYGSEALSLTLREGT